MSSLTEVMDDALFRLTVPLDMGVLIQKCFEDGIPLTNHQARAIELLAKETTDKGGFYTLANRAGGQGSVFIFYNKEGDITENVVLNFPNVSVERKIPSRQWLKDFFSYIGYAPDRLEIKMMFKLIDSHVRDGGSWTSSVGGNTIYFVLRMNEYVKSRYEFHKEDLTK